MAERGKEIEKGAAGMHRPLLVELWVFVQGNVDRHLRNFPPLDTVLEVADGTSHLVYGEIAADPVTGDRVEVFFDDGVDGLVHEGEGRE
jgi:hypothetical protein